MGKAEMTIFIIVANLVLLIFLSAAVIFIFQVRKRKLLHRRETEKLNEEHTQQILNTQLEIQAQTMQHLGREIHDNVGQKLTLASLYTQQLAYDNKAPQVNDKIESISKIINESLAELRQLSRSLTDDSINRHGITELLQAECEKINGLKRSRAYFASNKKNIPLSYQGKSILLRIVQEFFQNSIKYAACENIYVVLKTDDMKLSLLMKDDGKGFDIDKVRGNGIGLSNMKKRTELLHGSFRLQSSSDKGTTLSIEIPLKNIQS